MIDISDTMTLNLASCHCAVVWLSTVVLKELISYMNQPFEFVLSVFWECENTYIKL